MSAWIRALLGVAFGAGLLWIALAQIDLENAAEAFFDAQPLYLLAALAVYWIDIALRVVRWRILLTPMKPLDLRQVGQALIVGYAVNNVLPARLGEIFRADFVWRQFAVRRSAVLGSIVIERLLDGIMVVGLFAAGLMSVTMPTGQGVLVGIAITGGVGIVAGTAMIFGILVFHERLPLDRLPWLKPRILALISALEVVRGPEIFKALPLSILIWFVECVTFYLVVAACGVNLTVSGLFVVVGAASLGTLLPSAPGFIGSFQIAFVLAFAALGIEALPAIVASTLTQILLLGSVTLIGLGVLALTYLANVRKTPVT